MVKEFKEDSPLAEIDTIPLEEVADNLASIGEWFNELDVILKHMVNAWPKVRMALETFGEPELAEKFDTLLNLFCEKYGDMFQESDDNDDIFVNEESSSDFDDLDSLQ